MKRINNQQTSEVCSGSISFTVCQQLDCYLLFVIYHVLVTVNYSALPCQGLWLVKLAKYEYSKKSQSSLCLFKRFSENVAEHPNHTRPQHVWAFLMPLYQAHLSLC